MRLCPGDVRSYSHEISLICLAKCKLNSDGIKEQAKAHVYEKNYGQLKKAGNMRSIPPQRKAQQLVSSANGQAYKHTFR